MGHQSVILNASAGAGKTRTIIQKIKELLKKGVLPGKIMCISFTKNASENIMKRLILDATKNIKDQDILDSIYDIKFFTVHSFCYFFIKRFCPQISLSKICEDFNYSEIISKIPIFQYSLVLEFSLEEINNFISKIPEEIIIQCEALGRKQYQESLLKVFKQLPHDFSEEYINKVVEYNLQIIDIAIFLRQKRKETICLFDDLVEIVYKMLYYDHDKDNYLYSLCNEIDHIFVDESQDISPLQWKVLLAFIRETFYDKRKSFLVAGDSKQSIFSFQNADFEFYNILLQTLTTEARKHKINLLKIEENHSNRIPKNIIKVINSVFNKNKDFAVVEQFTHKKYGGIVKCWEIVSPGKQSNLVAKQIVGQIREWLNEKKYIKSKNRPIKPSDIMILFRKRDTLMQMIHDNLMIENIESSGVDKVSIFMSLPVKFILDFIKLCMDPTNQFLVVRLVKNYPFYLKIDVSNKKNFPLWDYIATQIDFPLELVVNTLSVQIGRLNPYNFLFKLLFDFEVYVRLLEKQDYPIAHELLALAASSQYSNIWTFIDRFPSYIKQQQTSGVKLSTIHSAKGLQSPIVIIADSTFVHSNPRTDVVFEKDPETPGVKIPVFNVSNEKLFNLLKQKNEKKDEFFRELYVAMTRAEDELHLTGWKPIYNHSWYQEVKKTLG